MQAPPEIVADVALAELRCSECARLIVPLEDVFMKTMATQVSVGMCRPCFEREQARRRAYAADRFGAALGGKTHG